MISHWTLIEIQFECDRYKTILTLQTEHLLIKHGFGVVSNVIGTGCVSQFSDYH